uniref:Carboxypeptidase n=2 Tax=Aegilops tauschii subsp. strangulata TaxID=200361 RepID=A0A453C2W4_AEGTS
SNSLYVGGESYCGMIIPTLALEIHISNKESGEEPLLNLKGYFAGNPVTDDRFDTAGKVQFFHGMGLLSDELYEVIHHLTKSTNSSSSRNYSGSTVLKQRTVYTRDFYIQLKFS